MYCPGCGKEVPEGFSGATCLSCGATLHVEGTATGPRPAGIPWEKRGEMGFLPALIATLRGFLGDPSRSFSDLPKRENLGSAFQYLLLLTWVGALGALLWGLLLQDSQLALLKSLRLPIPLESWSPGRSVLIAVVYTIVIPILVLVWTFIWTGIVHLVLWILGGAKEGFEATLRVYAYSRGSTALFELVPFCGGLVSAVWSLVLQIIGLSRVHEISGGKAALAVLLPLAFCCILLVAIIVAFAGAIMAFVGQAANI